MEILIGAVSFIVGLIIVIAICQTAANTGRTADYQRKSFRMLKAMAFKQGVIDGKGNFVGFYVNAEGDVSLEPFAKKKDGWPEEKDEPGDKLKGALL
jgi:hypothetical protein